MIWLIVFLGLSLFSHTHQSEIEAHVLSQILKLGYDAFGRNCLELLFVGAFQSLTLILPIGMLYLTLSFLASMIISFSPEKYAFLTKSSLDAISSLPGFLVALALSVFFPNSMITLFIASFFMIFPWLTRFLESHIISLKLSDHILASHALGASGTQVFIRHLFPDLCMLVVTLLPQFISKLLLIEVSLSFLGIGSAPEHETWGRLLYQGRDYLTEAPWILAIAGIPLCVTLFSLHLLTRDDRI